MIKNYKYLKDAAFLKEMDAQHLQEQYVKITLLDWKENPIQEIQGISTGGSISLNGNSSVRRTCNLSVFAKSEEFSNVTNVDNLFSINKKVDIEIGLKNVTNKYLEYPIIWYPQGVYTIASPSLSHSPSGINISLQLRDKMSLLNGDAGGTIPASTQFDKYDTINDKGEYITLKPTIHQIIKELVNHFGNEQLGKIIINDVPHRIKQVMKWIGNTPLYLVGDDGNYSMTTDRNAAGEKYKVFEYGEDIGYIYTDFVYPGELIGNEGDTVCTILDKIKNLLGNYEYYYDIDGNFIFQEIKNYLNTTHATVISNNITQGYEVDHSSGKSVYVFDDGKITTSFSNNPQYNMIKNDFVVWGIRKNANGNDIPIRYHLAVDDKPQIGNIYEVFFYEDPDDGIVKAKSPIPYNDYNSLIENDGVEGLFYTTKNNNKIYKWEDEQYKEINVKMVKVKTTDWRSELYLQGTQAEPFGIESNYYFTELRNEWPKIYNLQKYNYIENGETIYYGDFYDEVLTTPSDMDFYLDFIDSSSALGQFSVSNIGRRSMVKNSNDINCIFESDIPDFVIIEAGRPDTEDKRDECEKKNQSYIQVSSSIFKLLATGGLQNAAYEEIKNLLYQYTNYNNNISLQCLPIYHLEPNTRITVRDVDSDIYGDYMISTLSIPLDINGTTSISAQKALQKI